MNDILISVPILGAALLSTLKLAAATFVCALAFGALIAEISAMGGAIIKWTISRYVDLVRGIPLLVFIFLVYYLFPAIGLRVEGFSAAVFALSAYFSGFVAEILRGARESIPKGQIQSGLALGMTRFKVEYKIVAPQALRIALPGLINLSSIAIKSTSLVSIIGVWELTYATREIVMRTLMPFTLFLMLMLIYFVVCYSLAFVSKTIERKLSAAYR